MYTETMRYIVRQADRETDRQEVVDTDSQIDNQTRSHAERQLKICNDSVSLIQLRPTISMNALSNSKHGTLLYTKNSQFP